MGSMGVRTQGLPAAPRSGKWPVRQGQGRVRAARRGHSGDSAHPVGVGAHRHFVGVSGHGVWPQCVDPHGWQPHADQSTGLRGRPRPRLALPPRPLVLRPATSASISSSGKTGRGSLSNSRVLSEATWPPGGWLAMSADIPGGRNSGRWHLAGRGHGGC